MTKFSSELSGSLIFNSGSNFTTLEPYSGGLNISGSELYINQTPLSERITNVESGFVGSASLGPLNLATGSLNTYTASNDLRVGAIESQSAALATTTGSLQGITQALVDVTGSYLTTSSAYFSSSAQISSSGFLTSQSAAQEGFGSGGGTVPSGTISSSAQIDALGYITQTAGITEVSSSIQFIGVGNDGTASLSSSLSDGALIYNSSSGNIQILSGGAFHTVIVEGDTVTSSSFSTTSSFALSSISSSYVDETFLSASIAAAGFGSGGESVPSGTISSSAQISSLGYITSSDSVSFDGNRNVSNDLLSGLYSASFNAGTSGSISEFLEAIFFPNTQPTISTGNQTIDEFTASGSLITTVTGTDFEGHSLTFGTSSAYTSDFVRVSGSGEMTLNTLATGSMNTVDRGDGTDAHPIILRVVDEFGGAATKTIYLNVTLNQAPVFRETSVSGNTISSFTTARNENASNGVVTTIYFTDPESDTITITSQSDATGHFTFSRTGSYVRLLQSTGSLDYETTSSYSLSLTASDEHSVAGVDGNSFTTLPVTINVTDNVPPTFNNQTLTGVTESVASGTSAGTATATDDESDTITFTNFTLAGLQIDGSSVALSTYGGSGLNDPTEDAFQMASNGAVTLKAGTYLNSDLINAYIYSASASDPYNVSTNATVTIPVADDLAATISGTTSLYIIESATSGDGVKLNTDGLSLATAQFTANQSVTWAVSSSNDFNIDSSGYLTLARNISGSSDVGGGQLNGIVTATNTNSTTSSLSFTANITDNVAPTITFTDTDANLNTNGARSGSTITTITFADSEGDDVDLTSFSFTDPSGQLNTVQAGGTFRVQPINSLSGSVYGFTASIADTGSFETRTSFHDVTIASAPLGTVSNNGTYYIIESATSGSNIVINANGRTGTQGDIDVSYSPQYNSAAVQSFTSSNSSIVIDGNGSLTLGVNISGSATSSGDTIASTITYRDQYDNIGSSSISINVAVNSSPTASFSQQSAKFNSNLGVAGTTLFSGSITDEEGDVPYSASLSGTDAGLFEIVYTNADSSSFEVKTIGDLGAGDYDITASVFDNFGQSAQTANSETDITIAAADIGTLGTNGTFYIIESAISGGLVRINSNGRTGTQGDLGVSYFPSYGSPTVQSFTSSNSQVAVTSAGALTVAFNVSGSGTGSGDTITSDITFRDQYDNIGSGSITLNVTTNNAPDIIFTDTTANQNTNLGRSGSTLVTLSFSDVEGDTINYSGVTFENTGSQLNFIQDGVTWIIQAKENLSASAYTYTASVVDNHSFSTNTEADSFTIAAADIGTLSTNGTFYIIESAVSGDEVVTNSNGRTGTQADVSVSYSTSYGTPVVQSFTSSNAAVAIDSSGNITLGLNLSGSSTGSGDTISSDITFRDQFDNIGSGSITLNVTENAAPTVVSFTDITANFTASIAAGTNLVSMSIADTESNTPYSASLSGANASDLTFEWLNSDSSSAFIEAATTLGGGTYNYDVIVHDNFGKSTTYSGRSFTVAAAPSQYYIYLDENGTYASNESQALTMYGDSDDDGTVDANTTFGAFEGGLLGDPVITTTAYTGLGLDKVFLIDSGSSLEGSRTTSLIDGVDHTTGSQSQTGMHIIFPSGSAAHLQVGSMTTSLGGSTAGEYLLYADRIGTGIVDSVQTAYVRYFQFTGGRSYPSSGEAGFGVIFTQVDASSDINYFLMASSGSAPSSTQ